jgi:hypothetical protein
MNTTSQLNTNGENSEQVPNPKRKKTQRGLWITDEAWVRLNKLAALDDRPNSGIVERLIHDAYTKLFPNDLAAANGKALENG